MVWRILLPFSWTDWPLRWRHWSPSKHQQPLAQRHHVTSLKTGIFRWMVVTWQSINTVLTLTVVCSDLEASCNRNVLLLQWQTYSFVRYCASLVSRYFPVIIYEEIVLNFRSGNLAQVYKRLYSMALRESGEDTVSGVVSRLLDILSNAQTILSTQQDITRWRWYLIKNEVL
jgi:hypothetical protein